MNIDEQLRQAIASGQTLSIIYHGGSNAGAVREIAPIEMSGDKLRARCYASNAIKTYVISRIEIPDESKAQSAPIWMPRFSEGIRYDSLVQFLEDCRKVLESLGWHVECSEIRLSLHRRFKNGKPLKGADVSIDYEEEAYDLVSHDDGEVRQENFRKRQRPWVVRAKDQATGTYSTLEKAIEHFLRPAHELAPDARQSLSKIGSPD